MISKEKNPNGRKLLYVEKGLQNPRACFPLPKRHPTVWPPWLLTINGSGWTDLELDLDLDLDLRGSMLI